MKKIMKFATILCACLMVTSCDLLSGVIGKKGDSVKFEKYSSTLSESKFLKQFEKALENNAVVEMVDDKSFEDLIVTKKEINNREETIQYKGRKDKVTEVEKEVYTDTYKYDEDNGYLSHETVSSYSQEGPISKKESSSSEKLFYVESKRETMVYDEINKLTYEVVLSPKLEDMLFLALTSINIGKPGGYDPDVDITYYHDEDVFTLEIEQEVEENVYEYNSTVVMTGTLQYVFRDDEVAMIYNYKSETTTYDYDTEATTIEIKEEAYEARVKLEKVDLKEPKAKDYTEIEKK